MAKLVTLVDNFNDNIRDTTLWGLIGAAGGEDEIRRQVELTTAASNAGAFRGFKSVQTYDMTGSEFSAKLVDAGLCGTGAASHQTDLLVEVDTSNRALWSVTAATMKVLKAVANVYTQVGATITPYNPVAHKYLRIRESGGTVFFDYSADRNNWTNHTSELVSNLWAVTAMKGIIEIGTNSAEAAVTTAVWDDVNYTPPSFAVNRLRPAAFSPGLAR